MEKVKSPSLSSRRTILKAAAIGGLACTISKASAEEGLTITKKSVLPGYLDAISATTPPSLGKLKIESLVPIVDSETMDLHFNKHHAGYRNNLLRIVGNDNAIPVATLLKTRSEPEITNFGGGHLNHQLFWGGLGKSDLDKKGQIILGNLGYSLEDLILAWKSEANKMFGSGWSFLSFDPIIKKLRIVNTPNQDNPIKDDLLPIMGIDLWEHAYYLNYRNKRGEYIDKIWQVINWATVSDRIAECLTLAS